MSQQINAAAPNPQISGRNLLNYLKIKVKLFWLQRRFAYIAEHFFNECGYLKGYN